MYNLLIFIFSLFSLSSYFYYKSVAFYPTYYEVNLIEYYLFKIDIDFLTVIGGFNAVVLGFLVPFSSNSILKIKKLLPQQLLKDFNKRTDAKSIVFHSSISLFTTICLLLFFDFKVFIFFFSLILFIYFIYILRRVHIFYLALTSYENYEDIYTVLKQKVEKSFVSDISGYFESVNKISLPIVSEKNFGMIDKVLKDIDEFIKRLFSLDQEEFELIMLGKNPDFTYEELNSKNFSQIMTFYLNIYKCMIDNEKEYYNLNLNYTYGSIFELLILSEKDYIDYKNFLNIFFISQSRIIDYALEKNSMYTHMLIYRWYTSNIKNNNFDLSYLEMCDKQFFSNMKKIVDFDSFEIYKNMLDWFYNGIGFHSKKYLGFDSITGFDDSELYEYGQVLENDYTKIDNVELLKEWIKKFEDFKIRIPDEKIDKDKLNNVRKSVYRSFFFFNLKKKIRELGAYLLYRKRYDWIRYLWTFENPKESKSINMKSSILMSETELVNLFEKVHYFDYFGFIHDGNKDFRYFIEQYDFIYLWNLISKNKSLLPSLKNNISDEKLESIKYYAQEIEKIDESYNQIFDFKCDISFVQNFLETLISSCNDNIEKIVESSEIRTDKKEEFKNEFLSRYNTTYGFIEIYQKFLNKYKIQDHKNEDNQFGINTLLPKDMFVKDNVDGSMVASSLSESIISDINTILLKNIIEKCTRSEELLFFNTLNTVDINENHFILAISSWNEIRKESNFEDKHRDIDNTLDVNAFLGWYKIKNLKIPVFNINNKDIEKSFLILDKLKIPQLDRYELKKEDIELNLVSKDLENTLVKDLTEEEKTNRINELKTQVHFKAYESFNLEKIDDKQIGYIFKL